MIQILPCNDRFEELVQFAARLNIAGEHHIGFFGEGEAEVRSSLAESLILPEEAFMLAYEEDQLIGIFGVDTNPEIHRAWLFGPLVEYEDWHSVADELYKQVLPLIPTDIYEYDLFCDEKNIHMDEFATRHGFAQLSQTAVLSLAREAYKPNTQKKTRIIPYEENSFEAFEKLHDTVFPNTYFTARQIVEKISETRQLLLAVDKTHLLGYIFCKVEETGYIDFIGTSETVRGRGVGSDLLAAGVDWMLSIPEIQSINLTVHADNMAARHMYEKFGFVVERVMNGYRKQIYEKAGGSND